MELVVTSKKAIKIEAVVSGFSSVFEKVLCDGISVPDQVAAQPIGFEAGKEGAWGRIRHLRKQLFSHPLNSRVAVSIENFITEITPGAFFDVGCVALDDPGNQVSLETYSQAVSVPKHYVELAKKETTPSYHLKSTGYQVTAGEMIEKERPHIKSTDFHRSFGGTSRQDLLSTACQVLAGEYARALIDKTTMGIPCRQYVDLESVSGSHRVRVMQWNVLAQALMDSNRFKPIKERIPLFQRELMAYDPDIICLQEADLFNDFFKPFLSTQGYIGDFIPKVNSPCLKQPDNIGPCGCAVFYKDAMFRCLKKHDYVLLNELKAESNQVLLVEKLEHIASSQVVTVAVTHLKAKPEHQEMRLAQSQDIISKLKGLKCDNLVLSGDFNFYPGEKAYGYLTTQDTIKVKSVYGCVKEPKYTCQWADEMGGVHEVTVDYIWYSGSGLDALGFYQTPEKVKNMIFAPFNPSDHWPLIADFTLKS